MNYEEDIRIDETALDVEWLEQASLMMKYAKHSARARLQSDQAKENLDVVKAQLDKAIRTDPEKYEIIKVTEGAIMAAILDDPKYKEANKAYMEAQFEVNMAQGAVRAFDARKDALENLVRLHGQQYFAGPSFPRNLTEERELKQGHVDQKIGIKMKRKN